MRPGNLFGNPTNRDLTTWSEDNFRVADKPSTEISASWRKLHWKMDEFCRDDRKAPEVLLLIAAIQ